MPMPTPLRLLLLALLAGCATAAARPAADPDPTQTDGDKYQVVLENEQVRVLRYHDVPGTRTHLHHHPDFVLVALAPFRRQLTFPDGTKRIRELKAGEAVFMPAQSHVGENIGTTPSDALLIEVKQPPQ